MSAIRETGFGDKHSTNNPGILENDNTPNNSDSGILENDKVGSRGDEEGAGTRGSCENMAGDTDGLTRNVGSSSSCSGRARGGDGGDKQSLPLPVVRMRHLLAAARSAATRPGVTADMIAGYRLFEAGVR